jgi:hypothetical protein
VCTGGESGHEVVLQVGLWTSGSARQVVHYLMKRLHDPSSCHAQHRTYSMLHVIGVCSMFCVPTLTPSLTLGESHALAHMKWRQPLNVHEHWVVTLILALFLLHVFYVTCSVADAHGSAH